MLGVVASSCMVWCWVYWLRVQLMCVSLRFLLDDREDLFETRKAKKMTNIYVHKNMLISIKLYVIIIMSISVKRNELWCTIRDMRFSKCSIIIMSSKWLVDETFHMYCLT